MDEKILVTQATLPPMTEYIEEMKSLWDTGFITNMGAKHKELEQQLMKYMKADHLSLMTNGHMALELTIQAMGLTGEVITTPFTFASTTHAIVRNKLTPVFCDINPDDYTMDVTKIEALITEKTSAILPVHVFGNLCDVEAIERIARKHNLKVIYDAAHTFGVEKEGVSAAGFGDASVFSFHATKVFNTIEGGAVAFKEEALGLDLYRLKNFGIRGPEVVDWIGSNAKMNEFQAVMGICNLRHVSQMIAGRKRVVELYQKELRDINGLKIWQGQPGVKPNYSYFPVQVKAEFGMSRDELHDLFNEQDIYPRKYFYPLTSAFECYKGIFDAGQTPIAHEVAAQILTLPLYPDLSDEHVIRICEIIKSSRDA